MKTDFSVVIRCMTYNHVHFIGDALNGFCMQQTSFPFIAIVCDDASRDGEPEVIRNYIKEHFVTKVGEEYQTWETDEALFIFSHHQQNPNCYFLVTLLKTNYYSQRKSKEQLWQTWVDSAKYIAFCEGDDYWTDPLKLQKQVDFLESHSDYVVCSHDFMIYVDDEKSFMNKSNYSSLNDLVFPFTFTLDNFFKGDWTQPLTCLYRNENYLYSIPSQKYTYYRDRILFYYQLKHGKGMLLPDVMGVYRKHKGGVLSGKTAIQNYRIYINIAQEIFKCEHDVRAYQLFERHARGLLFYRLNNKQNKELLEDLLFICRTSPARFSMAFIPHFLVSVLKNKFASIKVR